MLYIKLDEDLNLAITVNEAIYRGENLSKKIIYLIPKQIGEIDTLSASLFLNYIRADGTADVVLLERMELPYNDTYLQYTFPVSCKLTRYPGEVCTWLQVYSGVPSDPVMAKSGECLLLVRASKSMDEYLCDGQVTAIYQIKKEMDTAVEDMTAAIEQKADNIIFHQEDSTIQLTSGGEPIGDRIAISTNTGAVVTNAGITTDGELILTFSDGTMKNLGSVVGKDGAVYVPHISDRKVLSFTLEEKPGEIPGPVDLNPFDEWSEIEGSDIVTDYVWEQM